MSARPAIVRPFHGCPRSTRRPPGHWRLLWAAAFLAAAAGAGAAGTVEEQLAALEPLAVHQPAAAARELDALLQGHPNLAEHEQVHAGVIGLIIADAQNRSQDVLNAADALAARLRALDDARLQMLAARTRFGAFYELGRAEDGWVALEDELAQAKRTGDDDVYAQALVDRAGYLIKQGDFEPAAAAIADAERRVRAPQQSAEVAFSNGLLARAVGDWNLALSAYQTAHEKFTAVGDRTGQADALARSAEALHQLGRAADAIRPLEKAEVLYREVDDRVGEARVKQLQAQVYADLNEPARALGLNGQAVGEITALKSPVHLARARLERAALLVRLRRPAEALPLIDASFPVVLGQDDLNLVALYYETAAETHAMLGKYRDAYLEMAQFQNTEHRQTEQLVAHQLAAQRGRLESERLSRENSLLRSQAASSREALAEARRAAEFRDIALGLGALVVLGALGAIWYQRRLMRHIARIAETDALTGMANRRHVLEVGRRLLLRCQRDQQPCAILMLDVDRFKEINDHHGHLAGDRALRLIAKAISDCVRPGDQIGRYGGEEFAVILPGADAAEAGAVAERVRTAVAQIRPDWAPGAQTLTVSGGIALSRFGSDDFNDLLVRADRALYRAKDAGRNRMEYHAKTVIPELIASA